jgi:hypothetical protein
MSDTNPIGFAQAAPRSRSYDLADVAIDIITDHLRRWARKEPVCLADVRPLIAAADDVILDDFELEIRGKREPPDAA